MDIDLRMLRIMFNAGIRFREMHPDDNEYNEIHFQRALKRIKKSGVSHIVQSSEVCKHE